MRKSFGGKSCPGRYGFLIFGLVIGLTGCSLLPAEHSETSGITGWTASGEPVTAGSRPVVKQAQGEAPRDTAPAPERRICRDLARTRASDAALSRTAPLDDADLKRVYEFTYLQCMNWHNQ